ncbi:2OG-Fe(II) oxygenase [Brevundimonas sp. 2R-24]|uniref:2OG-Fe(II) oxygenase n=1 Tax=Peiella sedimenti TaxID=3061083 RepID=A0ABT8SMM9_9CAUL|nr:2OG-Fe(II) oxygenase [Caulobacteraceae bacterium XZ-24]
MSARQTAEKGLELWRSGRMAEAQPLIRRAAREGEPRAQYQLALWKIWGDGAERDLASGHKLLLAAAAKGVTAARLTRAALLANGTGVAEDWGAALAEVRSAAGQGDQMAQQQLALLGAMNLDAEGRPAGDPPEGRRLSESPVVDWAPNLLTPEECAWLRARAAHLLVPSRVIDPKTGQTIDHPVRTSDGGSFGPPDEDLVVRAINHRLARVTGTETAWGEPLHMLRYRPGQEYRPHFDFLPGEANQRSTTVLIYLNEDYEGGETAFASGLKIRGGLGDAIVFRNLLADGRGDPMSKHAGLPVTAGEKWLATRWIRQRPYHPWGLQPS